MDDTAPLGKPLHGCEHRRVTLSQVFKAQRRFQLLRCDNGKATDAFTRQRPHRYEGRTVFEKHDRSKTLGIWGRPTQRKKRVDYRQND